MDKALAEARAKLQEQEAKKKSYENGGGGGGAYYLHWNMQFDESCLLRFLPDADKSNSFFWVEKLQINLPFEGIIGKSDVGNVVVPLPCMEMWGAKGSCPITAETRTWYKDGADPALRAIAGKYWPKKSYIFQGFVKEDPMNEQNVPENPIRKFLMAASIVDTIRASLTDPDIDHMPTDFIHGLDFRITKTKGPTHPQYPSSFSRKESALTEAEQKAIEDYGLSDLKELLPKKPDDERLNIMKQMFDDSLNKLPYDPEKYKKFYTPRGHRFDDNGESKDNESSSTGGAVSGSILDKAKAAAASNTAAASSMPEQTTPQATSETQAEKPTDINAILAQIDARKAEAEKG